MPLEKRRKMPRSETVSVRLDPKLRYLAGLAAAKHRRTLSSFIEWAIEESLKHIQLRPNHPLGNYADALWDVYEPERFVKLALLFPESLSHEEQIMWRFLQDNGNFWVGSYSHETGEYSWEISERSINWRALREHWDTLNKFARGECDATALPKPPMPIPFEDPDTFEDDADAPF